MADLSGFNANEVDPAADFDAIPPGEYTAAITESEMKPTKAGTGQYLQLTFQVVDGEHKGRMLWARLNLDNPNGTAVDIARAELSAICRAVNVMQPRDSADLHNIPLLLKVGQKRRDDTGEMTNEIKGYKPARAAPVTTGGGHTAPRPAEATGSTPPWKR